MVLLKVFVLGVCLQVVTALIVKEKDLLITLLYEDSAHLLVRPVLNTSHPVVVRLGFNLVQIINLNEREQYISMKVWLRMSWTNEFMRWQPQKWDNVVQSRVYPHQIWRPDIFLKEDVGESSSSGPENYRTPVIIYYTGKQLWMVPVKLKGTCIVDIKHFPYDKQVCKFVFTSWTHDQKEMLILPEKNQSVITSNYVQSSEWELLDVQQKVVPLKYPCCSTPYTDVEFTIVLKRKPIYYLHNLVVPCLVQITIIIFTFALPPESGERIGVLITVLLVFAMYLQLLSEIFPETSSSIPLLSQFFVVIMTETAFSLIMTCFVLKVHFKAFEKDVGPVPSWMKTFFIDYIAKLIYLHKPGQSKWKRKSRTIAFENQLSFDGIAYSLDHQKGAKDDLNSKGKNKKNAKENKASDNKASFGELIKEVICIKQIILNMNRSDEIEEEWKLVAKIMDRFCFILFLALFFISSFVMLLPR